MIRGSAPVRALDRAVTQRRSSVRETAGWPGQCRRMPGLRGPAVPSERDDSIHQMPLESTINDGAGMTSAVWLASVLFFPRSV